MGAFTQALTSGIGQAGEDAATGANNATLQSHQFLMDYLANQARNRQLDISQQQVSQEGQQNIFQRQYLTGEQDIQRKVQEQEGFTNLGQTYNPDTQRYEYLMYKPETQEMRRIAAQPPADSPEGQQMLINKYIGLKDENGQPLLLPSEAKSTVLKLTSTNDPTLKYQAYDEMGAKRYPNNPKAAQAYSDTLRIQDEKDRMMELYGVSGIFNQTGPSGRSLLDTTIDNVARGPANGGILLKDVYPKELIPEVQQGLASRGMTLPTQISPDNASKLAISASTISTALNAVKKVQSEIGDAGNSLAHDALLDLAKDPDSVSARIISRLGIAGQKDPAKTAQLASDLTYLASQMKTLQIPMGAAGYRGQAAWEKSNGDVINAMTAPGINKETLANIRTQLQNLLDATQDSLKGDIVPGMAGQGGNNTPPAASTGGGFAAFKAGQTK